jgi:hypothetical protein
VPSLGVVGVAGGEAIEIGNRAPILLRLEEEETPGAQHRVVGPRGDRLAEERGRLDVFLGIARGLRAMERDLQAIVAKRRMIGIHTRAESERGVGPVEIADGREDHAGVEERLHEEGIAAERLAVGGEGGPPLAGRAEAIRQQ